MNSIINSVNLGSLTNIRTGKLDANASSADGRYPFFTCARKPLQIDNYSFDCECVLIAGNGDLNVKYYTGKFDAYQRTYIIETKPEKSEHLDLRYVYHFMETYVGKLREQSIGGIIKYIKLGNLTDAEIPLPPLAEQKRIAAILDAAEALRAKRRQSLIALDSLIQSTFLDIFGDPVTNPKGWEETRMSSIANILTGFAFKSAQYLPNGEGIPLLRGINVGLGRINWKEQADWLDESNPKLQRYRLQKGDIALAMDRPWINGGLKVARVPELRKQPLLVQRVARIRSNSNYNQELLYSLIQHPAFVRHCAPTETTIPHISPKDLNSFLVIVPPLELQQQFAKIVEKIEVQKARCQAQLDELDNLFASLQSRAFKGEL